VKVFNEGLTPDNMDAFFTEGGKLDMLVEVCDGLDIKIQSRYKARALQVPVVMDTNDRGMLDVERFDLEPDREILHGLVNDIDPDTIGSLSPEGRMKAVMRIVNVETLSERLKRSLPEIGKTINTWPQLASSVTLGGAITTDICRRIFLNEHRISGRYYVDLDNLFT
jgi:hypothetical protein